MSMMFKSLRYQNPNPERSGNGLQDPSNDPSLPISDRSQSPFSPTLGVTADQYAGGNSFYQTMTEIARPGSPDIFNFNFDDYVNFDQEPSSPAVKKEIGPSQSPTRSDSSSISSKRQKSNDGSARSSFSKKMDDTTAMPNDGLSDNVPNGIVVPIAQQNGYHPHLWEMDAMNQMTYGLAVDSAESSPTDSLESKPGDRIGGLAMPYESAPNLSIDPTVTNEVYHETFTDSSGSSPIAMNSAQPAHAHPAVYAAPQNTLIHPSQTHSIFQPAPQHTTPNQWHHQTQLPATPQYQQKCIKLMYLSQDPPPYRTPSKYLDLKTNRLSTRVETALDIRLVLTEPPVGISKLRIHEDHLTKMKQIKDARGPLTSDTLELHVTAFCHTAIKTATDRQLAMNKALTRQPTAVFHGKQSQTDRSPSNETNDYKPLEGSPMKICDGCITREAKRLCRSKRKSDETDEWLFKASHCLLSFNNLPVVDWRSPNSKNTAEQLLRQQPAVEHVEGKKKKKSEKKWPMPPIDAGTVGADVQMRICCYCRHQHEATGFEVVFTLTDHRGKVFGQQMSKPIMITDDHKDKERKNSAPRTPPDPVVSTQAPGQYIFPSMPAAPQYPAGLQQSYSAPDLVAMAQGFGFVPPHPYAMTQQYPVTHVPQHNIASASQITPGTLTPQNRSRQASPTGLPEPQQKKRKASVSGRMIEQLRMTPMQCPQAQYGQSAAHKLSNGPNVNGLNGNTANGNVPNRRLHNGIAPNGAAVAARRPTQNQLNLTHRFSNSHHGAGFRTNPPSPLHGGFGALTEANRSQSMGNFATAMFSTPTSNYQSRAHSPNSGAFSNHMSYQPELAHALELGLRNAQATTNGYIQPRPTSQSGPQPNTQTHRSSPPQAQPQPSAIATTLQPPVVDNFAPAKGSIVGGDLCIFIGHGFRSDLQVLFGDHRATEVRSFAGGETLSCRIPRGDRAGLVKISFLYPNPQRLPSPSIGTNHRYNYVDEDSDMSAPQAQQYPIQGQSGENIFDCGQASQQYPIGNAMSQWTQGPNMQQQSGMPQHTRSHSSGQGFTETPPSYRDVLAEDDQRISDLKTRSTLRAVGDALLDQKAMECFEFPVAEAESSKVMQRVTIGGKGFSREQAEKLRAERSQKVKGLRSDRKLWTVWIPILICVLIAMFWNRFPQIWHVASAAVAWIWDAFSHIFGRAIAGTSSCHMPPGTQHEAPRVMEIG